MNGVFVEENHAWLRCKKPAIYWILQAFYALPCIILPDEIRSSRINRGSLQFFEILLGLLVLASLSSFSFARAADKADSVLVEEAIITDESIITQELSKLLLAKTEFQAEFSQRVTKNRASFLQQGRIYVQAPEKSQAGYN